MENQTQFKEWQWRQYDQDKKGQKQNHWGRKGKNEDTGKQMPITIVEIGIL